MRSAPIGFFDSGLGGLTIRREVMQIAPLEHTVYLADSSHAPYGEKPPTEILERSRINTRWLLGRGCKMIVVACNTATTNAIQTLREEFTVPFVGIEPAIKPAATQSENKRIGVLATRGTLSSSLFASTARLHARGIRVVEQEGTGLVRMIESGQWQNTGTKEHLKSLLAPMLAEGIDHLVLGCTHYPLLIPQLREILPATVRILDPGPAVARQVLKVLESEGMRRQGQGPAVHEVFTSGDPAMANRLLGWMGYPESARPFPG